MIVKDSMDDVSWLKVCTLVKRKRKRRRRRGGIRRRGLGGCGGGGAAAAADCKLLFLNVDADVSCMS